MNRYTRFLVSTCSALAIAASVFISPAAASGPPSQEPMLTTGYFNPKALVAQEKADGATSYGITLGIDPSGHGLGGQATWLKATHTVMLSALNSDFQTTITFQSGASAVYTVLIHPFETVELDSVAGFGGDWSTTNIGLSPATNDTNLAIEIRAVTQRFSK